MTRATRLLWNALGLLCVGLGVVGAFVPLMPSTVFLLAAAGCFARGNPRLERWLLTHKRLGAPIRRWRENRVIPLRAKLAAFACMAVSGACLGFSRIGILWQSIGIGTLAASACIVLAWPSETGAERNVDCRSDHHQSA